MPVETRTQLAPLQVFADTLAAPTPAAAMRIVCRKLLAQCSVTAPPIPLKALCEHLSIRVVQRETLGRATLRLSSEGFELWMSSDIRQWRRGRFTIAHEIAHALLIQTLRDERLVASLSSNTRIHNEVEALCNAGASEILMPKKWMLTEIEDFGLHTQGLQHLYDKFLVSYKALLFRIPQVIPSSSMTVWRRHARGDHEAAALRVIHCFPQYARDSKSPWLPKGSTTRHVRPDVVTEAFHDGKSLFAPDIDVELNGMRRCVGVATAVPTIRKEQSQLPLFDGRPIRDEQFINADAVLFLGLKSMSEGSRTWDLIRKRSLC
jgi:hypothetical protein